MEFAEEHLFEMMLVGTFALGWVSCYLTMKVFEVRGDRKKLEKESQTLASTESSGPGGRVSVSGAGRIKERCISRAWIALYRVGVDAGSAHEEAPVRVFCA